MKKQKKGKWTFLHWLSLSSLVIGLGIMTVFLFKVSSSFSIASKDNAIDVTASASIATFIGGVVGTVWTLVSIFLFYLNLRKQTEAIGLQQSQIEMTKKQIDRQQFENTFFNLLRTQQEIRNQISLKTQNTKTNETSTLNSNDFFDFCKIILKKEYDDLADFTHHEKITMLLSSALQDKDYIKEMSIREKIKKLNAPENQEKLKTTLGKAQLAYASVFNKYHSQLGHYFRHLYHILKFVELNQIDEINLVDKDSVERNETIKNIKTKYLRYVNFIQAQMSSGELLVLFYNGLCFLEMKKLIHNFNFLENLAIEDLISTDHSDFYCETEIEGIVYQKVLLKKRKNI